MHVATDPTRPASSPGPRNFSSIPPLPPIEIPRPTFVSSKRDDASSTPSAMDSDDPGPSSAHLSEESYATAYTSPFPVTAGDAYEDDEDVDPFKAVTVDPSIHDGLPGVRGLAKSMSVDSFIKKRAEQQRPFDLDNSTRSASPADSVSTSLRTVGPSSQHRLSSEGDYMQYEQGPSNNNRHSRPPTSPPATMLPELPPSRPQTTGRLTLHRSNSRRMNRVSSVGGRSFAPMTQDDPDSSPEDSDFEPMQSNRGGPLSQTRDELRRQALGPKRSGSLPSSSALPTKLTIPNRNSRTISSSMAGSYTNITTKNLPIRGAYAPRPPTVHAPPLKNKLSMPASFEPSSPSQQSRMRSQSIGDKSTTSGGSYDGGLLRADMSADTKNIVQVQCRLLRHYSVLISSSLEKRCLTLESSRSP